MQPSDDQQSQSSNKSTDNLRNSNVKEYKFNGNDFLDTIEQNGVNKLWDYEEILTILGLGKTQWILLIVCGLLTMSSMSSILSVGIIGIASQCEFDITQKERGIMMAACVTGMVLSIYIWGCMSDIWGRRTVLLWSMFMTNFFQFVTMFVSNIWLYNFINFLMGLSLGGLLGPIYPYLGEFTCVKYRALLINYALMFVSITVMYIPAISWLVLSFDWSLQISESFVFKPWRLIILMGLLPGLIGALILLLYPKSPKLLLAHNKPEEALKALNWIAMFNKGKSVETILKTQQISLKPEELADPELLNLGCSFALLLSIWKATVPMFQKPHGLNVCLAVMALLGLLFSSSGLQVWFPEIVNRLSGNNESSGTMCNILTESYHKDIVNITSEQDSINVICNDSISTSTYLNNIILGFIILLGFNIQGPLLQYFTRKQVLLVGLALGILCGILLHFVTQTTGTLILLCLFILVPVLSVSNMCGALVDLVPTHLRGKAVSLGFTLGRIGTILATNLIATMLTSYCTELFALITCVIIACAAIIYYLPI